MKFRNIFLASLLAGAVNSTSALEITTELPGSLKSLITTPAEVTELTVSGPIDATDLNFIGLQMMSLTTLDLSGSSIVAVQGSKVNGYTSSDAGAIPFGAFSGLPLKTIVFPENQPITIGDAAFAQTALEELSLPANIVSIGSGAFSQTGLVELSLPANIVSIGTGAFSDCTSLKSITMPACNIGTSLFSNCTSLTTVDMGGVKTIPANTFRGCTALTTVKGTENVVSIGDQAFEGDLKLSQFSFSPEITYIGQSAFAGTALKSVDLSEAVNLEEIGSQAFADANITEIVLPSSMTVISDGLLYGNKHLSEVELPESTTSIGTHAFVGTKLFELNLPQNLEEINDYALLGQDFISRLVLPASLEYIGDHAMEGMTGLQEIDATNLRHVPELGEDVWAEVDQPSVKLIVDKDGDDTYVEMFKNAEQWQNFNVIGRAVGVDDIVGDNIGEEIGVRGRFVGTDLQIESDGYVIDIVRIFDTSGRLLIAVEPQDNFVTIDTSDYPGGVFIVNILLDGKVPATLKLGRR